MNKVVDTDGNEYENEEVFLGTKGSDPSVYRGTFRGGLRGTFLGSFGV